MEGPDLDRLALPQMVTSAENDESMYTAFAVTVDLRAGTSTGGSCTHTWNRSCWV
jgi:3,4-dihydroxy 2-butanone 4-phosphate synthase/GTP cyclohydrolase II